MEAGLPWHWPSSSASKDLYPLRGLARGLRFGHRPWWQRAPLKLATALVWPAGVVVETLGFALGRAQAGVEAPSCGSVVAAFRCIAAALRHNVPPLEFYLYELWRDAAEVEVDAFLYQPELAGLLRAFNASPRPDPINDKLAFHDFCERSGLPAPRLLAYWEKGEAARRPAGDFPPPGADLWLKPRRGSRSQGQQPWPSTPSAADGLAPGVRDDLSAHLAKRSAGTPLLVQARLLNHPAVACVTNGALAAARVVSARRPDGSVVLVDGVMCLPFGDQVFSQGIGSLLCAVDMATGRLSSAMRLWAAAPGGRPAPARIPVPEHPDTGARTADVVLPDWSEALEHVCAAHAQLPEYAFLGWDVAFTPEGPVLLEGNSGWGCTHHQAVRQPPAPFGRPRLVDVVREHLGER